MLMVPKQEMRNYAVGIERMHKNAEANLSLHYDEQGGASLFRKQQ